jgi:hypothetical protein
MGELLKTTLGKVMDALVVVSLILGIAVESVSLVTGYYNMGKAHADRDVRQAEARGALAVIPFPLTEASSSKDRLMRQAYCISQQLKKNQSADVCEQIK